MKSYAALLALAGSGLGAALGTLHHRTPPDAQQVLLGHSKAPASEPSGAFQCALPPVIAPDSSIDGLPSAEDVFSGPDALQLQVKRHGAIVRVPSISYDDMGPPDEDPRWGVFHALHILLSRLYPAVHSRMSRTTVNTLGLVYVLEGSDPSLRPLMLAAHQDVVPVADASTWTHPPFSGYFDGTWLWGRGASDDKNSLTALFSVLEALLSHGDGAWIPRRSIVLALGFDEECSGRKGAAHIATYLEQRFGRNAMVLVLDEGGMGLQTDATNRTLYALPAVSEKGHVDVWYELRVQGGHSSIPFPHTGIGILADIITTLEQHPYTPTLLPGSPVHNHMVCRARYSPADDPELTQLVDAGDLQALADKLAARDIPTNFRLQTSQSVDVISGGVKINAMPELITLGVNYRVAPQNSIDEVKKNTVQLIQPIVDKYNLKLHAFEADAASSSPVLPLYDVDYNGTLTLTTDQETQVAPISPTSGSVWDLFSGTIQHTFAFNGTVVPVGELMTGNTDTRHYLNLTPNIFRWVPIREGHTKFAHTVDERIDMSVHMEVARFYYNLIRNFDASHV